MMLVPSNILFRIVKIKTPFKNGSGTIVEIGGNEFVLTAAHVVEHVHGGQIISLEGINWAVAWPLARKSVRGDIALLSFREKFDRASLTITLGSKGVMLSSDAFIAGFPEGRANYVDINNGYKKENMMLPFLRKGIISAFLRNEYILDCIIQRGFSGGPAFLGVTNSESPPRIFGVISSGLTFEADQKVLNEDEATTIRSGFTSCISVDLALELAEDELGIKHERY